MPVEPAAELSTAELSVLAVPADHDGCDDWRRDDDRHHDDPGERCDHYDARDLDLIVRHASDDDVRNCDRDGCCLCFNRLGRSQRGSGDDSGIRRTVQG